MIPLVYYYFIKKIHTHQDHTGFLITGPKKREIYRKKKLSAIVCCIYRCSACQSSANHFNLPIEVFESVVILHNWLFNYASHN